MRIALLLGCLFAATAAADTWRYVDEQGNVGFVDDPGKIPARYRDRATRVDSTDNHDRLSLLERVRQVFEPVDLPEPKGAAPASARQTSGAGGQDVGGGGADTTVAGAGGGGPGAGRSGIPAGGAGGAPQLNPDALKQLLDQFPTDRLTRKAVLAAVAAWESGLFWVCVGAIVLVGFILGTRNLINLVDSPRMQMFWRWGFPVLSGVAIALLGAWRYRAWQVLYTEMCRLAGI